VTVPVTADLEGGYSDDPRAVGDTIFAAVDAGIVGVNLEDGTQPPDLLCAKIQAARRAAERSGAGLFINARTDVFLRKLASGPGAVAEAIRRATRYAEAGADGVFVPGVTNSGDIEKLVHGIALPLNVMARPGLPSARELQRLGARRLSAATWLARAALRSLRDSAATFLATGDSDLLASVSGPSVDYNALFGNP
jgi:2-methylisocitrate lyase-like PEP mutase family enzyme